MTATLTPQSRFLAATLAGVVGGHGHSTQERLGLEFKLSMNSELRGRGECSPLPHYSPDSLEQAALVLHQLAPFDLCLPERPDQCQPLIRNLSNELPTALPSARFAFEGALVELFALHLKCSVATLLNVMADTADTCAAKLSVSKLITTFSLEDCLAAAKRAWSRGYRTFKLKVGPNVAAVVPMLSALRSRYGDELALRLDPNGSWPKAQVSSSLETLRAFEPEFIEEPIPWRELLELDESPLPLAVDESLVDPAALAALLKRRDALKLRAVVVKPALHGLLNAIELSKLARVHGLDVIVTHLFDGPIGHGTAASLALAVGSRRLAHGLAPQPGLLLDPRLRIAGLGQGWLLHTDQVGLPLYEVPHC